MEHYCTLFDDKYLPLGMALHESLMKHAGPFCLWILCMNGAVQEKLIRLNLPHVRLLSLKQLETDELRVARHNRSWTEYCWTVSPFIYQFVFNQDAGIRRVTYLDSDLYFYDAPAVLLREFEDSGKHVLLTEHAYAPECDTAHSNGRFCVQFMTFSNTPEARHIMRDWQEKCLEDCSYNPDKGIVGDQRYLEAWPAIYGELVHILQNKPRALAPWNVNMFTRQNLGLVPVFYHFQSLKIIGRKWIRLCLGYKIDRHGKELYAAYADALVRQMKVMEANHIEVLPIPLTVEKFWLLRTMKRYLVDHLWIKKVC